MLAPCKDCEKRHPCCHDSCEIYQKYKAEREAIRNERAKQKRENPPPHERRLLMK